MEVTASAEGSDRFSATARFGATAAYLLNEADIAPCGRDSAALRPCRNSGCTLCRAPLDDIAARSTLAKMNLYYTFMTVSFAFVLSCTASGVSKPQDKTSSKGKLKVVIVDWQDAKIPGAKILIRG